MKIKFNSDDNLPPKETLELRNMVIIDLFCHRKTNIAHKVFLDECLCKL